MSISNLAFTHNTPPSRTDSASNFEAGMIGGHPHVLPPTEGIFGAVAVPTLLLAADRSVIEANRPAHEMLAAHPVLAHAFAGLRDPAAACEGGAVAELTQSLSRLCDRACLRCGAKVQHLHFGSAPSESAPALPTFLLSVTAIGSRDEPSLLCVIEHLGRFTEAQDSEDTLHPGTDLGRALGLTPRQTRVAAYLAQGCSPAQIAERLGIKPNSVRRTLRAVMQRVGVRHRHDLALHTLRVARRMRTGQAGTAIQPIGMGAAPAPVIDWV